MHRHVFGRVFRRRTVGRRIDAVDGKIALMLRPLPVVGVAAERRDAHRRRRYQPHVAIHQIERHVILVAIVVRRADEFTLAFVDLAVFLFDLTIYPPHGHGLVRDVELLAQGLDFVGHVPYLLEEIDGLPLDGKFLVAPHGPETVFQVVVAQGAQGVDVAVGTVMVGDHQAVVRDHAAGAAES